MKDLIEYVHKLHEKCDSYKNCYKCPLFLTTGVYPRNTRCALQSFMAMLGNTSPDHLEETLERIEKIIGGNI